MFQQIRGRKGGQEMSLKEQINHAGIWPVGGLVKINEKLRFGKKARCAHQQERKGGEREGAKNTGCDCQEGFGHPLVSERGSYG